MAVRVSRANEVTFFFLIYLFFCFNLEIWSVKTKDNLLVQDRGDEFTYTGSGGRDLSGNKRIGEHSFDQTLTHMNR